MKRLLILIIFIPLVCFSLDYKVKKKDILEVSVEQAPDLNKTLVVSEKGTIRFPLLGEIEVEGKTLDEVRDLIKNLLKKYYFMDYKVNVSLKEKSTTETSIESIEEIPFDAKEYSIKQEGSIPTYRINPYDTLQISVYGEPDLSTTVVVSDQGTIRYALLGEIKVEGLSTTEVAAKIEELLKKGYLVNPKVNVTVTEYSKVSVFGEVNQPGSYELKGPLTLLDVIVLAGGLKESANPSKIKVIRSYKSKAGEIKEYILDLEREGKSFYLYPLDKIILEKYGLIFITGAVKSPGAFKLEKSNISCLDAITFLAGGALDNANLSKVKVIRQEKNEKKEYIINLLEDASFIVKENDKIVVDTYKDISIFGQVKKPGNYPYKYGMTVVDAITLAGGFTDIADTNGVKVVREFEGEKKTIKVPVGYILKTGDRKKDIPLEEKDTIIVPESWL